jgi:hypothetical protein
MTTRLLDTNRPIDPRRQRLDILETTSYPHDDDGNNYDNILCRLPLVTLVVVSWEDKRTTIFLIDKQQRRDSSSSMLFVVGWKDGKRRSRGWRTNHSKHFDVIS